MAEHVKIKCKKPEQYQEVTFALAMEAVEYYQKSPDKAIHLCGLEKKKDIENIFEKYGIKKAKIKIETPDYDKVTAKAEKAIRNLKKETEPLIENGDINEEDYEYDT